MFSESEEDQDPMKTTLSNCGILLVFVFLVCISVKDLVRFKLNPLSRVTLKHRCALLHPLQSETVFKSLNYCYIARWASSENLGLSLIELGGFQRRNWRLAVLLELLFGNTEHLQEPNNVQGVKRNVQRENGERQEYRSLVEHPVHVVGHKTSSIESPDDSHEKESGK